MAYPLRNLLSTISHDTNWKYAQAVILLRVRLSVMSQSAASTIYIRNMMLACNKDFAACNIEGNILEEHTVCESQTREIVCNFATCNIHHLPTCNEHDVRMQHGFSTYKCVSGNIA